MKIKYVNIKKTEFVKIQFLKYYIVNIKTKM